MPRLALLTKRFRTRPYGEQLYVENLLRALGDVLPSDWRSTIVTYGSRFQDEHTARLNQVDPKERFNRRAVKIPYTAVRTLGKLIGNVPSSLLFGPQDVVHNFAAQWQPAHRSTIVTIQDCSPMRADLFPVPDAVAQDFKEIAGYLTRMCARVITISNFSRDELVHYLGVDPNKISVVPNGVDRSRFHPATAEEASRAEILLSKLAIPKPYLIHMGGFAPRKNVVSLIKAFNLFKEKDRLPHRLLLIGAQMNANTLELVAQSPFAKDIFVTGYLSDEDVTLLLQQSHGLVFPSTYEGFGLPPLEAMACGVSVASSNATALPESAGEAAIYFEPFDIERIASCLTTLCADDSWRAEHIRIGLERAEKMSWHANAVSTFAIYQQLLSNST